MNSRGTYLLVLPWDPGAVGGVNQVVLNLYQQFAANGPLQPRLLVHEWDATTPREEVTASGVNVTRVRVRPPYDTGPADLFRFLLRGLPELRQLARLIRAYDVRVVNCHYIGSATLTWSLAKLFGMFRGKLILSLHGLDIRTIAKLTGLQRAFWRYALERADAIIACSQGLADETIATLGLSGRNVVTIHNGVRAEQLRKLSETVVAGDAVAGQGPQLLNLGTFEHKKGHDLLVRAFVKVAAAHPTARLTIMGRPAATLQSTQALIEELGLQDRVTLRTNVPHADALAVLKAADVFALPSRNEAFSVALLEAGALAKPVVAASVCGVPELIENGRTGIMTPVDDVDALAAGIIELLQDREKAAEYGRSLQQRVLTEFTAEKTYERYAGLIARLTTG